MREIDPAMWYAMVDSFAYVAIDQWSAGNFSVTDFDNVLDSCRSAKGIILDVRPNEGGNQDLALDVAGRFTSVSRIGSFSRVRNGPSHSDLTGLRPIWIEPRGWTWSKPVAVLIGRTCFSSNEGFISAMQAIPSVTLIGDTTGGGSGNPKSYTFSFGWQYTVPQWIEYTADTTIIEWNGIAPDILVPTSSLELSWGVDPVFGYAMQWLEGRTSGTKRCNSVARR